MKKTISNLTVAAGVAMALCLTSCGGNGSKGSEGDALADTLSAENLQEQAQDETTKAAAAEEAKETKETEEAEEVKEAEEAKEESTTAEESATLNTALLGRWTNGGDGDAITLVVSDKYGTYDEQKGYGYVSAFVEYEPVFTLVFTRLTPDGDRILVHYNKMETYMEGGDPDDLGGEDYGEWVTRKAGEGDLTLIPANGRLKIESRESLIKNKTLHK